MGLNEAQKKERSDYLGENLIITECSQKIPYAFISYASDNWETVFKSAVVPLQKRYGLRVYSDKAFDEVNDKWIIPMLRNIRGADMMIAFVSQSYIESYACFLELLTAANTKKPIVFVSLGDNLHLGDTTDMPNVERGIKKEILNQGANIATNTNNTSNDLMRAMKSAYTSISTLLEQDVLSKYDISDAFINFFRDASINQKTINNLPALKGTINSISRDVFDKSLITEPVQSFMPIFGSDHHQEPQPAISGYQQEAQSDQVIGQQSVQSDQAIGQQNVQPGTTSSQQAVTSGPGAGQQNEQSSQAAGQQNRQPGPATSQQNGQPGMTADQPSASSGSSASQQPAQPGSAANQQTAQAIKPSDPPKTSKLTFWNQSSGSSASGGGKLVLDFKDPKVRIGAAVLAAVALILVIFAAVPKKDKNASAGNVPEGYISIEELQTLLQSVTLPAGYLEGESRDISDERGSEINSAVEEMETRYLSSPPANAPKVQSREWSMYTSPLAKQELESNEAEFYDRLDELCRRYIDSAALDGVEDSGEYATASVTYDDLDLTKGQAKSVAWWFKYNNPQYYFIGPHSTTTSEGLHFTLYDFAADGAERAEITNQLFDKLDGWIESVKEDQVTTWQKELAARNLLCKQIVYQAGPDEQSLYSAVMTGETVCSGYAQAFSAMMNAMDIETVVALSATHAWNVVQYDDGEYYAVDVTWDDNKKDDDNPHNRYFNVGEISLKALDNESATHTYSDKYGPWTPAIAKNDCTPTNYDRTGSNESTVQLDTPAGLQVESDKDGKIRITWDAVDKAAGYTIEIYEGDRSKMLVSTTVAGASAVINYGTHTSIAVRVRAEAASDGKESASRWSELLTADTKPAKTESAANAVKPDAPQNVKTMENKATSTSFSWDEVEGADQYQVMIFKDADYKETWQGSFVTKTAMACSKLQPETTYYYGVRAVKTADGKEYYSEWTYFSETTAAESGTSSDGTDKLAAPENVKIAPAEENKASVTWDEVAGATGYQICKYEDSTYQDMKILNESLAENHCKFSNLTAGTAYYFGVRAIKTADGQDMYSDWVPFSYTPEGSSGSGSDQQLAKPADVKTAVVGEGEARVTWNEVPGATGYQICTYTDSSYKETKAVMDPFKETSCKLNLTNPEEGKEYYLGVRAVKAADGKETYSDWVQFTYTYKLNN